MSSDEDRLLRIWTPRILRGVLAASAALLVVGLVVIGITAPDSYVARYQALRGGQTPVPHAATPEMLGDITHLRGHALLAAGLLLLTLVPIGRVAFTVVVFLRQRDWLFLAFTGVVLTLLGIGVLLGRMG